MGRTLTVTPSPLTAGGTASIRVEGASGTTIEIRIDNGVEGEGSLVETVTLTVNDQGVAEGTWEVPDDPGNWDGAVFNVMPYPSDVASVTRFITPS